MLKKKFALKTPLQRQGGDDVEAVVGVVVIVHEIVRHFQLRTDAERQFLTGFYLVEVEP